METPGALDAPSIASLLGRDHDRLDALLERAIATAAANPREARWAFREFATGLARHIEAEETVLFPTFDRLTGLPPAPVLDRRAGFRCSPTFAMRAEHAMIARVVGEAAAAVEARDSEGFHACVRELVSVLGPHNESEESFLYPLVDRRALDAAEREALVLAVRHHLGEGAGAS